MRCLALRATLSFTLIVLTSAAWAMPGVDKIQGSAGDYDQGMQGTLALGYTSVRGNTVTSSLDARAALTYGSKHWYHALTAEKIRTSEDNKESANTLSANAQSDYLFTPTSYAFLHLGYTHDDFGGITQRTSETTGYGFRIINHPDMIWSVQLGFGARQEHVKASPTRRSAIAQLATSYSWTISDHSRFSEDIVVERGHYNTRSESATRLTLKIIDNLSLVVAYTIKHNSSVPLNTKNTDAYTSVSAEYTF